MQKKRKPSLNLILLGDPGAGKATQSRRLSKKYAFFDFDMGRELALARRNDFQVDAILKHTVDKGILAPTKIVRKIFKDRLESLPSTKGIVFDGTPKMLGEAKLVTRLFKKGLRPKPMVMYLSIPHSVIFQRVMARKGYFKTKYSKRSDDSVMALKNRAKYYKKNIKEVVKYFKKMYTFVRIDASGTKLEVYSKIVKEIDKFLKSNLS